MKLRIMELMNEAGNTLNKEWFERFAQLIRNETLEEAAKEFDRRNNGNGFYDPHEPAEIIRALKEPT